MRFLINKRALPAAAFMVLAAGSWELLRWRP